MKHLIAFLGVLALGAFAAPAQADPLEDAFDLQVLPGWRAADGTHIAAVEVTLAQGWKTYWRAPGDAGIPPQFDWRGSRNLSGVEITWPTPEAMIQDGMQTVGYSDRLILPLRIAPKRQGRAIELVGEMALGVCKDICIPVRVDLTQALLPAATQPDPRIAAALADRPYSAQEAGVGRVTCKVTPKEGGLHLSAELELPSTGGREVAVIETDNPEIWVAPAETHRKGGRLYAETELYHNAGRSFALNRSGVRITVLGESHAVDVKGCSAG